jgi:Flp pilus assembly protein CpaB
VLIVLFLFFVPVAAVGSVGALWAAGAIDLPFFSRKTGLAPGMVALPASPSSVTIPAYTKITRDLLFDARTGDFAYIAWPADKVPEAAIRDINQVLGRVLDHDKPGGYVFTENDFLPKGTRAGMVAGIPAGKRSLTLEAEKLSGIHGLRIGDHIDLLSSVPIDMTKGGSRLTGGLATQAQMATMQKRASVRVLAQDAVLVTPVTTRMKPLTSNTLKGAQTKTIPVQEVVIAVDPSEVAPIHEAMAADIHVMCVARSGLPDDPGPESITPGSDPLAEVKIVDAITGSKREYLVMPASTYQLPDDGELTAAAARKQAKNAQAVTRTD